MRIAFVVAVFPPEPEPTAVMAAELARAWSRAGHDVHVLCPVPNRPVGTWYPGHPRRLFHRFATEGYRGTRLLGWPIGRRRRALSRLLENVSFGASSALALLFAPRPDVIVCESWPVFATLAVLLVARLRGIPTLNYIKDVYPEAAVAARLLPAGGRLDRAVLRLDRWACHTAALNVLISDRMALAVARTRALPPAKVAVVRDWLDLEFMKPGASPAAWRHEVGIPASTFVCLFAGTMGHASKVDVLVDVAALLQSHDDLLIVCVGEGVLKEPMQVRTRELGLRNLRFLPFQPRDRVPDVQAAADVMLLPTSATAGVSSVPSKLVTYMAMARPVICAVAPDSDIAELIHATDSGRVVAPESASEMAAAILEMKALGAESRHAMGQAARQAALQRHSLATAIARFDELLARLHPGSATAPAGQGSPTSPAS